MIGVAVLIVVIVGIAYVMLTQNGGGYNATTTHASTSVPATTLNATNVTVTTVPSSATNATSYTVGIATDSSIGQYLINATGHALYTYTQDTPSSGSSSCNGGCIAAWPAFYTANITVQSGINASKFGTITRAGGAMQTTYNGWPLYFYKGDTRPGEASGNNVAGFVAAKP